MTILQLDVIETTTNQQLLSELKDFASNLVVKNVTKFKSHDGSPLSQCDLYYNKKKVCFASDDAWGSEMRFDDYAVIDWVNTEESKRGKRPTDFYDMFKEKFTDLAQTTEYGDYPILLESFVSALIEEKDIQKDSKKGVVVKNNYGWEVIGYKKSIPAMLKKYTQKAVLDAIQKIYDAEIKKGGVVLNTTYLQNTLGLTL